ncbi:MAG: transcriptional regulator [Rhodospirillales bacterium]|nr:MAG: transcriptional regulator [Rhodospirillales bacterium]
MKIEPIRAEAGYDAALLAIEHYFDVPPLPESPEAERFDTLASVIAAYEREHWPIGASDRHLPADVSTPAGR